jgi:hypothetical protein
MGEANDSRADDADILDRAVLFLAGWVIHRALLMAAAEGVSDSLRQGSAAQAYTFGTEVNRILTGL